MTPIAILATHQVKKVKGKKFIFSSSRIQILAILFHLDCAINQFCKYLLFQVLPSTRILRAKVSAEGIGKGTSGTTAV